MPNFTAQNKGMGNSLVSNVQIIEIAAVWWESITTTFKAKQNIHELHVC